MYVTVRGRNINTSINKSVIENVYIDMRRSIMTFLSKANIPDYLPFCPIIQCASELPAVKQCFFNFNAFGNLTTSGFMNGFQIVPPEPLPPSIGNVASSLNHGWCLALTSFVLTGTQLSYSRRTFS